MCANDGREIGVGRETETLGARCAELAGPRSHNALDGFVFLPLNALGDFVAGNACEGFGHFLHGDRQAWQVDDTTDLEARGGEVMAVDEVAHCLAWRHQPHACTGADGAYGRLSVQRFADDAAGEARSRAVGGAGPY